MSRTGKFSLKLRADVGLDENPTSVALTNAGGVIEIDGQTRIEVAEEKSKNLERFFEALIDDLDYLLTEYGLAYACGECGELYRADQLDDEAFCARCAEALKDA